MSGETCETERKNNDPIQRHTGRDMRATLSVCSLREEHVQRNRTLKMRSLSKRAVRATSSSRVMRTSARRCSSVMCAAESMASCRLCCKRADDFATSWCCDGVLFGRPPKLRRRIDVDSGHFRSDRPLPSASCVPLWLSVPCTSVRAGSTGERTRF